MELTKEEINLLTDCIDITLDEYSGVWRDRKDDKLDRLESLRSKLNPPMNPVCSGSMRALSTYGKSIAITRTAVSEPVSR